MDRKPPPIIKSGAKHSVQIALGTKNAKSVRNVVTSDADAPLEERMVLADDTVQRGTAELRQDGVQVLTHLQAREDQFVVVSEEASDPSLIMVDDAPSTVAGQGVVAAPSLEFAAADQGPVRLREERGAQDVQVDKAAERGEHRILVDAEDSPADTEGVIVDGRKSLENRQRIQALQAKANRIRLDAEQARNDDTAHALPEERERRALDLAALREPSATPNAAAESVSVPDEEASPVLAQDMPEEVASNFDHRAAKKPDAKESALMARLRALKSNMSVTENRLTQLKPTEPPQS